MFKEQSPHPQSLFAHQSPGPKCFDEPTKTKEKVMVPILTQTFDKKQSNCTLIVHSHALKIVFFGLKHWF